MNHRAHGEHREHEDDMMADVNASKSQLTDELNGLSSAVIGAAIEVHRVLGPGYAEAVYEEALCIELAERRIPFLRQATIQVRYKDRLVGEGRLDILVANVLIVELKVVDALAPVHISQLLSYLKATGHPLGLLMNFNVPRLMQGVKRLVL